MGDLDLTDYVELAARTYVETNSSYAWDRLPEIAKNAQREIVLPVVDAVLTAYVAAHPYVDMEWLEGIG